MFGICLKDEVHDGSLTEIGKGASGSTPLVALDEQEVFFCNSMSVNKAPTATSTATSTEKRVATSTEKRVARASAKKEGSGDWTTDEIEALLCYLDENFRHWSTGKKVLFYQNAASSGLLPGRDNEQIKNKINKLRKKYLDEKVKVNSTGAEPSKWAWYDKMDNIFGHRENIAPSCLISTKTVNVKDSDDESDNQKEEIEEKEVRPKKCRKLNPAVMLSDAISTLGESRNQVWDKRLALQDQERKDKVEIEKLKMEYDFMLKKEELDLEKMKAANEQKQLDLELQKLRCSSFMSED
jgi:hypothetical protein